MKREELKARLDELTNSIVTDPGRLKEFIEQWSNISGGIVIGALREYTFLLEANYPVQHIARRQKTDYLF